VPPPQSTSVSVPFRTVSVQLGGWQIPPEQTWLWQSVEKTQCRLLAQGGHVPPPQSTSVSFPSTTPFKQGGSTHTPFAHVALWQLLLTQQA
jgi:hypothetical protein